MNCDMRIHRWNTDSLRKNASRGKWKVKRTQLPREPEGDLWCWSTCFCASRRELSCCSAAAGISPARWRRRSPHLRGRSYPGLLQTSLTTIQSIHHQSYSVTKMTIIIRAILKRMAASRTSTLTAGFQREIVDPGGVVREFSGRLDGLVDVFDPLVLLFLRVGSNQEGSVRRNQRSQYFRVSVRGFECNLLRQLIEWRGADWVNLFTGCLRRWWSRRDCPAWARSPRPWLRAAEAVREPWTGARDRTSGWCTAKHPKTARTENKTKSISSRFKHCQSHIKIKNQIKIKPIKSTKSTVAPSGAQTDQRGQMIRGSADTLPGRTCAAGSLSSTVSGGIPRAETGGWDWPRCRCRPDRAATRPAWRNSPVSNKKSVNQDVWLGSGTHPAALSGLSVPSCEYCGWCCWWRVPAACALGYSRCNRCGRARNVSTVLRK